MLTKAVTKIPTLLLKHKSTVGKRTDSLQTTFLLAPATKIISKRHSQSPSVYSFAIRSQHSRSTASDESKNTSSTDTVVGNENFKYGFARSEMYQSSLGNTVDPYDRHVFLCYKSHDLWPSRVEGSNSDPLPKLLASVIKARKSDMICKTRFTICEGGDEVELSDGDVLVFPEMIIYRGLKDLDVDAFVRDVLVDGKPWAFGVPEKLTCSCVFVCSHNNRDRRCGVCGPILIEKFKEEIDSRNLKDDVLVTACSHVGGHKYAGNVIIFSTDTQGRFSGNWYGYVTPDDAVELIDKQIVKGEVIHRIWRGRMGKNIDTEMAARILIGQKFQSQLFKPKV